MITAQVFYTAFFFILGLIFGSFYNVVGIRVPKGESIVFPGSHCSICQRDLKWYELIPVFSFLFLRGKCRTCKTRISPIYPVMELINASLFALVMYHFGLTYVSLYLLLLFSLLVIITVSDLVYQIIPNKVLLVFTIIMVPLIPVADLISWKDSLIGFAVAIGINLLIILLSKGKGMGGGDVKLFILLGLVLGWKAFIVMFMLSVLIGIVVGVPTRLIKKTKEFPFGPSIALATILTVFYGNQILDWYLNMYL